MVDDGDDSDPLSGRPSAAEAVPVEAEQAPNQGRLILDATAAEQAIRFPTDLGLLNEAREISEQMIDLLYPITDWKRKPRTCRREARQAYLAILKQRRPGVKTRRRGIRQQLQYVRRNLKHLEHLLDILAGPDGIPLPAKHLRQYWIIQHVFRQQALMYRKRTHHCNDRIVSIHQPHVRPIARGKLDETCEFGAKLSASLDGAGLARVDALRWGPFPESHDFEAQVKAFRRRHSHHPEVVIADTVYGTRSSRRWLGERGIRFAGKELGRPKKETPEYAAGLQAEKARREWAYRQRISIEGKFGQGEGGYELSRIPAKLRRQVSPGSMPFFW